MEAIPRTIIGLKKDQVTNKEIAMNIVDILTIALVVLGGLGLLAIILYIVDGSFSKPYAPAHGAVIRRSYASDAHKKFILIVKHDGGVESIKTKKSVWLLYDVGDVYCPKKYFHPLS